MSGYQPPSFKPSDFSNAVARALNTVFVSNINSAIAGLNEQQLRVAFQGVVPRAHNAAFAINYAIPVNDFYDWMEGRQNNPTIANKVRSFLLTQQFVLLPRIYSNFEILAQAPRKSEYIKILVDGDNVGNMIAPLLRVGTTEWEDDIWVIPVFRAGTIPPFIQLLQEFSRNATSVTFNWLTTATSLTTSKSAADTVISSFGTQFVTTFLDCFQIEILLVSNDRFIIELSEQMRSYYLQKCMDVDDPDALFTPVDQRRNIWRLPGGRGDYTTWVIEFLQNYPDLPVNPRFSEIVRIIREEDSYQKVQQRIRQEQTPARRQELEQQLEVLLGRRFLTDSEMNTVPQGLRPYLTP